VGPCRTARKGPSLPGKAHYGEAGGRWKALSAESEKKAAKGVRVLKEGKGEKHDLAKAMPAKAPELRERLHV
jgi:hypothetical protein